MDSQRSLKKIQRVQRAGVTRAAGQRRPVGFTLLLVVIVIVGLVLTAFARSAYRDVSGAAPRMASDTAEGDRYRNAFGIYLCDRFIEPLADVKTDTTGIHSHDDGLIHIHPSQPSSAGSGAVIGKFFDAVGLEATPDVVVLPEGADAKEKTWTSGTTTCKVGDGKDAKKEKGQWALLEYPAQAGPDTEPIVHTDDFGELPVRTDGQAWTLAFLPEKQIDNVAEKRKGDLLPPSIEALKNPDNEQEPGQGDLPANPGENIPTDVTVPAGDDPAPTTGETAPTTAATAPVTTAAG